MMVLKFLELGSNYFFTSSTLAAAESTLAAAESTVAAAESTTAAAESTVTAAESTAGASAAASAFLQDTTVKTATTAKLKNTFFILLYYKRLIINSRQRYKFFNM
jgi:Tfp pilus assembly protein PilX